MFLRTGFPLDSPYINNKVTLTRLGAPLLFAYDAKSFVQRLRGIHGVPILGPTDAFILRRCKAIHTLGVKQPLDVAFVDRRGVILKLSTVQPNSFVFCVRAATVVEMAAGTASRIKLAVGQTFVPSDGDWL